MNNLSDFFSFFLQNLSYSYLQRVKNPLRIDNIMLVSSIQLNNLKLMLKCQQKKSALRKNKI